MLIGCHVSIAGGLDRAPERASALESEMIQIFTRSPRGGKAPEISAEIARDFKEKSSAFGIRKTAVHTPYYVNFASDNNRIRHGSASVVRNELERASLIGAACVMTHLGSSSEENGSIIAKVSGMLTKALDGYDGSAELLLENSAGSGRIIGSGFGDLAKIIELTGHSKLSGICLDTQHSFASGYDWRDFEKTVSRIDREIGLDRIRLIHANDSLTEFASKKDRHAHIGQGEIGLEAFKDIVSFAKNRNIDLIAETEHSAVLEDIRLLKRLRDSE